MVKSWLFVNINAINDVPKICLQKPKSNKKTKLSNHIMMRSNLTKRSILWYIRRVWNTWILLIGDLLTSFNCLSNSKSSFNVLCTPSTLWIVLLVSKHKTKNNIITIFTIILSNKWLHDQSQFSIASFYTNDVRERKISTSISIYIINLNNY